MFYAAAISSINENLLLSKKETMFFLRVFHLILTAIITPLRTLGHKLFSTALSSFNELGLCPYTRLIARSNLLTFSHGKYWNSMFMQWIYKKIGYLINWTGLINGRSGK